MIRSLHAAAAFALIVAAAPAFAQAVVVPAPGGPAVTDLGPDDEVIVREYIVRRAPPAARFQPDYKLRPGSVVPDYVDLAPMADSPDPKLRRYSYFLSPDDKYVVVDPASREVIRILDR